ncbi:MAG: S1-like domain-containing RNA-binding protein [Bacteroidales bacterium]|nr:S1-like domain-containing RNA-binding protein [Bacteroidales bacterium]
MFQIGKKNTLKVIRKVDFGFYLDAEDYDSVLLPKRYAPENLQEGDELEVFIYLDSEDRIIATTETPFAEVNEFAYLTVKEVNKYGAYLDWGLPKDLFVPYREQKMRMTAGKKYWVYVYVDQDSDRIAASAKIDKFLDKYNPPYSEGDEVSIQIHSTTELGTKVIVDSLYWGIIYKNELFEQLSVGETKVAYIKKVREDLKLDISLVKSGYLNKISDIESHVLTALEQNEGFLPLHDKSDAEEIKNLLSMSKKSFKMAVGGLYKAGKILIENNGIRLK